MNVLSTFGRQNSVVKNWQLVGGSLTAGPLPVVQPAQWLIRHCASKGDLVRKSRPNFGFFCPDPVKVTDGLGMMLESLFSARAMAQSLLQEIIGSLAKKV